jgi:excisionase family DNA binding protein
MGMATVPTPKLLSLGDTAERLNVSIKTVRRWVAAGSLPAFQLGRQWRIDPEDLERFLWHHRRGQPGRGDQ